jgi:hypothetical protein
MLLVRPDIADDASNLAALCTGCHAIKTHHVEPRLYRGDFDALEWFYGHDILVAALIRLDGRLWGPPLPPRRRPLKTHCPSGHSYDETNTYRAKNGYRKCRSCAREREKRKAIAAKALGL